MALFAGQRGADLRGDSDPQLQILNKLNEEFPGRVDAVSYDSRPPRLDIFCLFGLESLEKSPNSTKYYFARFESLDSRY